jgi:hypothetical protein
MRRAAPGLRPFRMAEVVRPQVSRIHKQDCACRNCRRATPAEARAPGLVVGLAWMLVGLVAGSAAVSAIDHVIGGPGVRVVAGLEEYRP